MKTLFVKTIEIRTDMEYNYDQKISTSLENYLPNQQLADIMRYETDIDSQSTQEM